MKILNIYKSSSVLLNCPKCGATYYSVAKRRFTRCIKCGYSIKVERDFSWL